jgi:hypothetical protein
MSPESDPTHIDTTAGSDDRALVAVGVATVDRTDEVTNLPEPDGRRVHRGGQSAELHGPGRSR